jgi:Fatty acid hydroxylase superfamily
VIGTYTDSTGRDVLSRHSPCPPLIPTLPTEWLGSPLIPVRGKHLDELTRKDLIFIGISKAQTAPFVYLYLRCGFYNRNVIWTFAPTLANTLAPLVPLFIIYDFFYTALHWFLHIKSIYSFVHKHHHVQKAPSRANVDAINVHPVEFFLGEYNHLLSLYLCTRYVCQVHVVGSVLFLAVGGALAGFNHTRYDIVVNLWGVRIFDSKAHDVHHRIPQSNYGQYTMLWDYVFGTFRCVISWGERYNDCLDAFAVATRRVGWSISSQVLFCFISPARTIRRIESAPTPSSIRDLASPSRT